MSSYIIERCKEIRDDDEKWAKVHLAYRPTIISLAKDELGNYEDETTEGTNVANAIRQIFDDEYLQVIRHIKLYDTVIFNFKINANEYNMTTLSQAIKENRVGGITKVKRDFMIECLRIILDLSAEDANGDVLDLWQNVEPKKDSYGNIEVHPLLDKLKDFVDSQNYDGCLQGLLRYPHLNQDVNIKQTLLIGFTSNSGKSLLDRMFRTLYQGLYVAKEPRYDKKGGNEFIVGGWNESIRNKFVVIIGDDNPENPPSEDFIKNIHEQPLSLRKASEYGSFHYDGSTIIISNTQQPYFKKQETNKRIKLINLDLSISKDTSENGYFTKEEVDLLYGSRGEEKIDGIVRDIAELKTFLMKYDDTTAYRRQNKNKWNDDIEDEVKLTMRVEDKACSYKLLNFMYGRDTVEDAIKQCGFELKKGRPYNVNTGVQSNDKTHPHFRKLGKVKIDVDRKEIVQIVHQHNYTMNLQQRKTKKALMKFYDERIDRVYVWNDVDPRFDGGLYFVKLAKGAKSKQITKETVDMHTAFVASWSITEKSLNMLSQEMSGIFEKWIVVQTPEDRIIDDITGETEEERLFAVGFFDNSLYQGEYKEFCKQNELPCTIEALPLSFSDVITSETFGKEN